MQAVKQHTSSSGLCTEKIVVCLYISNNLFCMDESNANDNIWKVTL